MQQQQLAAQLAHHGGSRQAPISPAPHTSDSDSDISLGAHSPPITSPGPRFGAHSPTPLSTFRFGPHSPGPMPAQFRFTPHSPPSYRRSPQDYLRRGETSPINVDTPTSNYKNIDNSPIDVESTNEYKSPIRVDSPPPMNLRVTDRPDITRSQVERPDITRCQAERPDIGRVQPENPIPIRLGTSPQLTQPLRIRVNSPSRMISPHTNLLGQQGIVRIAPPSPPTQLHRPFSPARLT